MLKVLRVITDNSFSYQNVEFMDFAEDQEALGINKYVTDKNMKQIVIRTDDGKVRILTDFAVGVVEVRKMKAPATAERISRMVINGEISYGPVYLIRDRDYEKNKVPRVFGDQLSFVADGSLYICHQMSLIEIVK